MNHHILSFVLPALLFLGIAGPIEAQWRLPPRPLPDPGRWVEDGLIGTYTNTSNDGRCEVYRRRGDFVFVNENGTRARFAFSGPRTLEMVSGDWNPDVVATVGRDRDGRRIIRFKEPGQPAGVWVRDE